MFYPSSRVNPPRPPARVATNSASNMTNITETNLQLLRIPSHLGTGVEKERADASLNTLVSFTYVLTDTECS